MGIYNIFKQILKWGNTEYIVPICDIRQYLEYLGYRASNFSDSVKQILNEMMRSKEIQNFAIEAGNLVITK